MEYLTVYFVLFSLLLDLITSLPEPGKAKLELSNDQSYGMFKKVSFKNSQVVMIGVKCDSTDKESPEIEVNWRLKYSPCAEKFINILEAPIAYVTESEGEIIGMTGKIRCNKFVKAEISKIAKWNGKIISRDKAVKQKVKTHSPNSTHNATDKLVKKPNQRKTRSVVNSEVKTPMSGAYMLVINARAKPETNFKLVIAVEIKGKRGYLSATEWPLLPFFGVMSLVYAVYAAGWFVASCLNWRDLLRIQFWIGAVVALGMLEKALFFSEYQNVNHTGEESNGLVVFAELISCVKRTLARILVIIVSMGFGIVKPRLGSALPKILACGLLFFILATVEGCFRALSPKAAPSRQQMIAAIPLVVLDSVLCWWVFTALVQTTRTLRIRKNVVKLSLYRHFTNTLIFAVVASVIYMAWSIKTHTYGDCTDWTEVWLDDAFWPFLFSLVLLVIMILWRPTNNNQRYAFTPLVDASDDEDETNLSEAYDGMKLRGMKKESNGNLKNRAADDDLKWVEENIPSIPTTVLPSLDSDEEIMTTKLEMSKME
ncbi:transmembrane protein 87A-like [Rhopilema esculentum]|uniref:transmembrane protein 87A-like n=1 Tax=Rhopilema esculentum TaxID=499914 RepID=UPI0031D984B0